MDINDNADTSIEARRGYSIGAHRLAVQKLDPALYLVATPIGHLADITIRALETLAAADLIACEDTRTTRVLLDRYAVRAPMMPYHEHNAAEARPKILAALAEGKAVALVSDAGTPLISDPGYKLVEATVAAGHRVIPIPGASALLTALVGSGLPTDSFLFAGFLTSKEEARRRRIEELAPLAATTIFYESPHRLGETLAELAAVMGDDRPAAIGRELTKTFEEFVRGSLGELAARYATAKPKGEIVIVVAPAPEREVTDSEIDRLLAAALARETPSKAAAEVARLTGRDRKSLYERVLAMKAPEAGAAGSGKRR
jgi:16S rRNA (cytidine1402-2'-O)-methyltransferase